MEQAQTAKHYHLFTGEIVFLLEEQLNAVRVNGILASDDERIPVRSIAQAHQILQMNFFKQHAKEDLSKVKVIDVVVINISHLGLFEPAEFHREPEGTKLQEKASSEPVSGPALVRDAVSLEDALTAAKKKGEN